MKHTDKYILCVEQSIALFRSFIPISWTSSLSILLNLPQANTWNILASPIFIKICMTLWPPLRFFLSSFLRKVEVIWKDDCFCKQLFFLFFFKKKCKRKDTIITIIFVIVCSIVNYFLHTTLFPLNNRILSMAIL